MKHFDIAIVGSGILGLAHAWAAIRKGLKTVIFERDARCFGASVRNFGMIWPIGQPAGELQNLAMTSREHWLKLRELGNLEINECGSLHLARRDDELAVLEEFTAQNKEQLEVKMLTPSEVASLSPAARIDGLLAAMWSSSELGVNPVKCIDQISSMLSEKYGLESCFGCNIVDVDSSVLTTSSGVQFSADRIVICSGSDFETLFPKEYFEAGLKKCKLQMMSTNAQPASWRLGPHLAGGLTLRHYRSFEHCASVQPLAQRIREEQAILDTYGIHVMASQDSCGRIILGDSHQYDAEITPFDSAEIEELMLVELKKMIQLPDFNITRRWHGIYAKHPEKHIVTLSPQPNCRIVTAPGGAGMTLGFGIAEQTLQDW